MINNTTLTLFFSLAVYLVNAQNVVTYAGKVSNDADNNYESTSGKDLTDTYFSSPNGLCFDNRGKMYISEKNKIRIVTNNKLYIRSGSLQRPAFSEGYKNASGAQATYRNPMGMASDTNGNIYVADVDNHCIRKIARYVNLGNVQVASTFAGAAPTHGLPGNGTTGTADGTGTSARFNQPTDIAIDNKGNLYVSDLRNYTIRKITPSGVVTTLAGKANTQGATDGTGEAARFGRPWGVAVYNSNTLVVTDPWNNNIRKINIFSGATTTLAGPTDGPGVSTIVDGTLVEARFKSPKGIAVMNGIIYVADENVVRAINESNNSVTTIAGSATQFVVKDGIGTNACFTELSDLETDGAGNLYVTENSRAVGSHVIRKITINELAPIADFESTKKSLKIDEQTTLTDISRGENATSRKWTITPFNYAINEGSLTSETLKVSFTSAGFYELKLDITNGYGSDTKISENYFAVSTTGTGSVTAFSDNPLIQLYPNPSNDLVHLTLDPSLDLNLGKMTLYSTHGNKVMELAPVETIDLGTLENGTYYLTYTSEEHNIVKRMVVSHK
jgi:sugar lactone lactonase YvrE